MRRRRALELFFLQHLCNSFGRDGNWKSMRDPSELRPRNAAATRTAILTAARTRFIERAYEQVGLRTIANDVGVDPALIPRYFGSKEGLFAEVLASTTADPMDVLGGDRASFGTRVAREFLDPSRRSTEPMAFIQIATRSSASPTAGKLIHRHIEKHFMAPFTAWLSGKHASETAWVAACVMTGVVVMAGIYRRSSDEKTAAMRRLAPLLQQLVDDA